jgi:hypothetical protein
MHSHMCIPPKTDLLFIHAVVLVYCSDILLVKEQVNFPYLVQLHFCVTSIITNMDDVASTLLPNSFD